ncbi:hypothetical protein OCU04_012001 [Sclerotinia nivalis]|uniref:Uncharacterized protein n=1 Tax=Sclerotinia nivalis TaxID=352851 RepID=A0A9X0AA89_9HELO|nr:hypothetical protein OCU04_012001 [Sclerotinia nivalis]
MASCGRIDRPNEHEEKGVKIDKKRKYKSPKEMKPKTESGDDDFYSDEEGKSQVLSLHSTDAGRCKLGSNTFVESDSEDEVSLKKPKFTVKKFPQKKVCAVVKLSSNLRQHEHERGLPRRLAELKTAIENLSDDWDVIMRAHEVSTVDALHNKIKETDDLISGLEDTLTIDVLHEQIEKRDEEISKLKDKITTTDALHKTMEEKDAIISELRDANERLQRDFAQQADKVKVFEEWKSFMKLTLDLEASEKK